MQLDIKAIPRGMSTEKDIEKYLAREIAKLGGTAYKFNSEQRRAVPDRICVLPGRVVVFVECKRPNEKPTPAQQRELDRLRDKGQLATWVSSKEEVQFLIESIENMRLSYSTALFNTNLRRDND